VNGTYSSDKPPKKYTQKWVWTKKKTTCKVMKNSGVETAKKTRRAMKILIRVLKVVLAVAIATQSTALLPALAASQGSKPLAVKAIGEAEVKSEFGAGGGGGGGDPVVVVDPGDGGGSCTHMSPDCTTEMYQSDIIDKITTQTEDDAFTGQQLHNGSAINADTISKTFSDNCRVILSNTVGISVPWGISIGLERSCANPQVVSKYLLPLQRANIYRDTFVSTWTEYRQYKFRRNGVDAGYAGSSSGYYRQTERMYFAGPTL
jgi:hypothetical protein